MHHVPAKIEYIINNYSQRGQISEERRKIQVSPWVPRELIMKQILVITIQLTVLGRKWAAGKVIVRNQTCSRFLQAHSRLPVNRPPNSLPA